MQLKTVVLPAPLGPMIAVISRGRRGEGDVVDRDQAAEAHGEMLDLDQRRGRRIAAMRARPHGMQPDRRLAMGDQAARPPHHDQHHGEAEGQHAVVAEVAEPFGQADQQHRRQHDADLAAHAAQHDDREDDRRIR